MMRKCRAAIVNSGAQIALVFHVLRCLSFGSCLP